MAEQAAAEVAARCREEARALQYAEHHAQVGQERTNTLQGELTSFEQQAYHETAALLGSFQASVGREEAA